MWFIRIEDLHMAIDTPVLIHFFHVKNKDRPTETAIRKHFKVRPEYSVAISPISFISMKGKNNEKILRIFFGFRQTISGHV